MTDELNKKVNAQLEELKEQMKSNIAEEQKRGASLENITKKTKRLEMESSRYKKKATETKWKIYLEYGIWIIILAVVLLLIIYIIFKKLL